MAIKYVLRSKKRKAEYPKDFLVFWNGADRETRKTAACIGYLCAKKSLLAMAERLRGGSHV